MTHNGDKDEKDEEWELEDLGKGEANAFRSMPARMNYMGQDGADPQFPVKRMQQRNDDPENWIVEKDQ